MKLLGVDVGGTFTDIVYTNTNDKKSYIFKTATTPEDPSIGVLTGVNSLCDSLGVAKKDIKFIFHGTTIGTNALLEHDGAETGMITTEGYRDIIHIGRHQRPLSFSVMQEIPWQDRPLVKRRFRKTVSERMGPNKDEKILPLDEQQVRETVQELKFEGVESIVVNFLFSYINPDHEERVSEIIQEEYPGVYITTSSNIVPQFREFERFTTASVNGFIGPKVKKYIDNLKTKLQDNNFTAELRIMSSNGGVATAEAISQQPVNTLLSGPAAGVLGGFWYGKEKSNKILTFDVGGTSADIGIVTEDGFAEASARDSWVAGYPVIVPMIDIQTIGAGGGSVAYVDEGGAFKVGPRSSGATPGPACYGLGGKEPTVTDANVVLGRLIDNNFLGGDMHLDTEASHRVIEELAKKLNLDKNAAADGVLQIMNNNMANAIREKTVQKGEDPREFSLVAFGGAGPLHAAEIAKIMDIPNVIIPSYPGINSAIGLLTTDIKYDKIKTEFILSSEINIKQLNEDFISLIEEVKNQLKEDDINEQNVNIRKHADCRYVGQGYELNIDFPNEAINDKNINEVFEKFHKAHKLEYGHDFKESSIEIVNIRVTGIGEMPNIQKEETNLNNAIENSLIFEDRSIFSVDKELKSFDTKYYKRDKLPVETELLGPCVIVQDDTTTVIPPDSKANIDLDGNIIIRVGV